MGTLGAIFFNDSRSSGSRIQNGLSHLLISQVFLPRSVPNRHLMRPSPFLIATQANRPSPVLDNMLSRSSPWVRY